MPEQYEWEWLKHKETGSAEQPQAQERQIDNLRRWIESEPAQGDRGQVRRRERRQRLKQAKQDQTQQNVRQFPNIWEAPPASPPESPALPPQNLQAVHSQELPESLPQESPATQRQPEPLELLPQDPPAVQRQPELPQPAPTQEKRQKTPKQAKQGAKKECMPKKDDYREWLKQDFGNLFDTLDLQERQRHYLKSRWLDQVLWMESRAGKARDWHYKLRLTTIIGGVIIPALVSLNFTGEQNQQLRNAIAASTFVLSQAVAICAATEQFFNYGERWRHYRRSVETLKTQGWQFFELSGPYQTCQTHNQAFNIFAAQVEQILQQDVEVYATQVTQAKKEDNQKEEAVPTAAGDGAKPREVSLSR